MKKKILSLAAITMLLTGLISCNGKKKDAETSTSTESTAPAAEDSKTSTGVSEPKTYQLSATPDSVLLGKDKEAFVTILGGEAIEMQDNEGKSTGMNIKFKLRVTNKSTLDDKKFFNINSRDARLELDNGTNTTATNGDSLNPEAESTLDGKWEFDIPAGTKPTKLNLFYDGTRVSVAISMK
jgi:hypothetical protein